MQIPIKLERRYGNLTQQPRYLLPHLENMVDREAGYDDPSIFFRSPYNG